MHNSNPRPGPAVKKRGIVLFGAGPLPEPGSCHAPGVPNRLWNFMQPALAGGHRCLAVSIEPDAAPLGEGAGSGPESRTWQDHAFQALSVAVDDCKQPAALKQVVEAFGPEVLMGAGTLQASATACRLAGGRPVWADLFGDPLAEVQARADLQTGPESTEHTLLAWELMLEVLGRADAFSVVSRRQADALLGQLGLLGRLGTQPEAAPDPPAPSIQSAIHVVPCSLESLDLTGLDPSADRWALWNEAALPTEAKVALWSGGFNAWADPVTLIEGVEAAMDELAELHLVATGGELPGYLERVYGAFKTRVGASRHRDRMRPLGWHPLAEANRWLAAADLGLLTDRPCAETRLGSRNRLLYHAAARCPVVATRGTEIVADMEAAGVLVAVPRGDAKALGRAIVELLAAPDRAKALGRRAHDFCALHYVFHRTAQPWLDFLADPARSSIEPRLPDQEGATQSATATIAQYLDVKARRAEWRELASLREGPLARLRQKLKPKR